MHQELDPLIRYRVAIVAVLTPVSVIVGLVAVFIGTVMANGLLPGATALPGDVGRGHVIALIGAAITPIPLFFAGWAWRKRWPVVIGLVIVGLLSALIWNTE